VTSRLHADNRERELSGLCEALSVSGLKTGVLITENQEETIQKDSFTIRIVPAWKWLLDKTASQL
jgi:predicted AAA+ superfamily ATPase